MNYPVYRGLGAAWLLAGLLSCIPQPAPIASVPDPAASPAPAAIPAGRYCYGTESDTLSGAVRLTITPSQQVSGDSSFTIHNQAADYYSSYAQAVEGSLEDAELAVNLRTWIEYDVQDTTATWQLTPEQLTTENEQLSAIDCAVARQRWVGPEGLFEASDLIEAATAIHTERIAFAPGSFSATVTHSVIRGERDLYLLNIQGGQMLTLDLTSLENNAVLDVITPSGFILARESTQEVLLLPHTGDYQILVGSSRGNTSYELVVEAR